VADAGRVIAGTARGIRLEAPGPGTRPLADRVKQTLFAILEPDLAGARGGSDGGASETQAGGDASAGLAGGAEDQGVVSAHVTHSTQVRRTNPWVISRIACAIV